MSKVVSKKRSDASQEELSQAFAGIDTSDLPDFYALETPLDRALWVLWAAKDGLKETKLTAAQMALLMRDVLEVRVSESSIAHALRRAGDKVHTYRATGRGGSAYYQIMKAGKDHLVDKRPEGSVDMLYFEAGKKYSSKRMLSADVIPSLAGNVIAVDPYCGPRTLDVLGSAGGNSVRVLTTVSRSSKSAISALKRELKDFRSEYPNIEFRVYPGKDLHDRYILSSQELVILGHSMKDLGSKESFAIVLSRGMCEDIAKALSDAFEVRWQQSGSL